MNEIEENQAKNPVMADPAHVAAGMTGATAIAHPATNGVDGAKKSFLPAIFATRKRLLTTGNKLRVIRGGVTALLGGLFALTFMSVEAQFRWGVAAGFLGILVASVGVLDFWGTFDDPEERVATQVTGTALRTPVLSALSALLATLIFIGLAVQGRLPIAAAAVLIPLACVALVVTIFRVGVVLGPWALDEAGQQRALLNRHGFWVVLTGILL
ncbi:MAG TPA: hypothetical protein VGL13_13765, partial [Polyangiaceae bacterium]